MSKEIEKLKNIRVQLEEESRALTEEQKSLEERVQMLEEKIAIEEQKNRNKEMREAIAQLKSKINELEQRLKAVSATPEPSEPAFEPKPELETAPMPEQAAPEIAQQQASEEAEEATVTVTPLEEPMLEEGYSENVKRQHEKKKRKFF